MVDTTFVTDVTVIEADWLNDANSAVNAVQNVAYHGALGGTTDDTAAIAAAIAALPATGGTVVSAFPNHRISTTITIDKPVMFIGLGAGSDTAPVSASSTKLEWYGGAAAMIQFVGSGTLFTGGGLKGLELDCRSTATYGLIESDHQGGEFHDLLINHAVVDGILLTNTAITNPSGFSDYSKIKIQLRGGTTDSANGIHVAGVWTSGVEGTTLNNMTDIRIEHANGAGVLVDAIGDAFTWTKLYTFRADVETGIGVWFTGGATQINGGHLFVNPVVSSGFRFDGAGGYDGVKIINMDTINVNTGLLDLIYGTGSCDVSATTISGIDYGERKTISKRETIQHDAMRLIRWDSANNIMHTSDGNWLTSVPAGGSIATASQSGGAIILQTSNVSNEISAIIAGGAIATDGVSVVSYYPNLNASFSLTDTTNIVARIGLLDSIASPPTNGVYLEYDSAVNANWRIVCMSAGTPTATVTTLAAAVQKLQIRIESTSTSISFYYRVNGFNTWGFLGSIATIPTATVTPTFQVETLAAAFKNIHIYDYKFGFRTEV